MTRTLMTRKGEIRFPTYVPVTTFGKKYPLDDLIRPYLPRLAQAMMVSYYYAKQMDEPPRIPLWVDSGGFASLFKNARVIEDGGLGVIELQTDEGVAHIHPKDVLELQEQIADVAFTLDFPIPPQMDSDEAKKRQRLTITNAKWALENRRRSDLPLYASLQAWDADSARACATAYHECDFDGVAIGGLVPRIKQLDNLFDIVKTVRTILADLPLHVFGIGKPALVQQLQAIGVDSVDSSSYVKYAAEGRMLDDSGQYSSRELDVAPTRRLQIALSNLAYFGRKTLPLPVLLTFMP